MRQIKKINYQRAQSKLGCLCNTPTCSSYCLEGVVTFKGGCLKTMENSYYNAATEELIPYYLGSGQMRETRTEMISLWQFAVIPTL